MVVQIDGLRILQDSNVLRLLFWFRIRSELCGTNAGFEMNKRLSVFLFWNDILVESSCILKFSNRFGKVKIFVLPLLELCCLAIFWGTWPSMSLELFDVSVISLRWTYVFVEVAILDIFSNTILIISIFFELFSSLKCFTSSLQVVCSTFFFFG